MSGIPLELPEAIVESIGSAIAKVVIREMRQYLAEASPWMTTEEAIAYSRIPEGTFRKLAAAGEIRSHGGRTKIFHKQELDQDLGHVPPGASGLRAA